nr:MAG TPA: hypothetical protein [Caudoviricetes sp.]
MYYFISKFRYCQSFFRYFLSEYRLNSKSN